MRNKKGFTLIELMVVVAIIAVLTGIVMANFTSAKKKARDGKRVSDVSQIQLALEQFYERCGAYPATLALTTACPTNNAITLGQFLPSLPRPPVGTTETDYKYAGTGSGTCTGYHLGSTLETDINTDPRGPLYDDADRAAAGTVCTNSGADFSGGTNASNDTVYDVAN